MNFKYKLMRFMSGRYGTDALFYALFFLSAAIAFVNIFLRLHALQLLGYLVMIYALFRVLSRNLEARRRENSAFLRLKESCKQKKEIRERRKNDRCHVYKKCPSCSAILRLPRRIGVHTTVCPKCGKEFTVKVKK